MPLDPLASPLYVDSATGSKEYAPALSMLFLANRLPVSHVILEHTAGVKFRYGGGDFVFGGNGPDGPVMCGIELKKLPDFIGSAFGGSREGSRLTTFQLPNMRDHYGYTYLIIEGAMLPVINNGESVHPLGTLAPGRPVFSGGETWFRKTELTMGTGVNGEPRTIAFQRVLGKLHSLMIGHGVKYLWSFDEASTAALVFQIWSFWQKPWDSHEFASAGRRFKGGKKGAVGTSGFVPPNPQVRAVFTYLVEVVEDIGPAKAQVVASQVRSIEDLVKLDVAGLRKLGLGDKAAWNVWNSLRARGEQRK